jgi:hypothetical protein
MERHVDSIQENRMATFIMQHYVETSQHPKLLKEEIAQTVAGPDELNDELRNLLVAIRSEKC